MEVLGIRLVGVNPENGQKLLLTLAFVALVYAVRRVVHALVRLAFRGRRKEVLRFWTRQGINLATTLVLILGLLSVWFDDPARLATALGLVTAGLAFALQRVVTAVAGYFVILRGQTFGVGDRITMGGVRGDVIGLGFTQTTIMEMGQPPAVQGPTAVWVRSRQYTGRVVTVSNAKIFDEPVYNYTREFPYLWRSSASPSPTAPTVARRADPPGGAERQTGDAADTVGDAFHALARRYVVQAATTQPKVYYHLTDNWLELTVRFVVQGARRP